MLIRIETTPQPNIRNFYPDQPIFESGTSEFTDAKSLRKSPLAEAVYDLGGIQSLIITADMVSVTKLPESDWETLSPQIMAEILDFAAEHSTESFQSESPRNIMNEILALIDARIRPALQKDGGDIEVLGFENGIVTVRLTGHCASCPYAMQTLKGGVEKILKNYIPEVIEVQSTHSEG